ncbi:hypothetical protein [Embleya sp. NPDC050493]|uniref:hypothetical protein n=1 Tax=Embleya sp. NPDC050493 TaxID=3363989 RepID=UPI003791CF19
MKLATVGYDTGDHAAAVVEHEQRLVLLDRAAAYALPAESGPLLASMLHIIEGGDRAREAIDRILADPPEAAVVDVTDVRWRAPLPNPPQIRDFGGFMDHFRNARARMQGIPAHNVELPQVQLQRPLYYIANRLAIAGHESDVRWPAHSTVPATGTRPRAARDGSPRERTPPPIGWVRTLMIGHRGRTGCLGRPRLPGRSRGPVVRCAGGGRTRPAGKARSAARPPG